MRKFYYFLMAYLCSFIFALNFQFLPPILPLIINEWEIGRGQAGLLMGVFSLPPLLFSLLGGYFLDKYGTKVPTVISLGLLLIGDLLCLISQNYPIMFLGRLIMGSGAIVLSLASLRVWAEKFKNNNLGLVMGIGGTAAPIATFLSFNLFSYLGNKYTWKTPILILTILTSIVFLLVLLTYKEEKKEFFVDSSILSSIKSLSSKVWILGLVWVFFNAGSLTFLTFAPDFFTSRGMIPSLASSVSSIYIIGAFFGPFVGYFLDKIKKTYLFIFFGTIFLSIVILLIGFLKTNVSLLFIAGIFATLVPPSVFYTLPKLTPKLGLGYAALGTLINFGNLVAPTLVGFAKDITKSYNSSFILMSIFILTSGLLSLNFRRD